MIESLGLWGTSSLHFLLHFRELRLYNSFCQTEMSANVKQIYGEVHAKLLSALNF